MSGSFTQGTYPPHGPYSLIGFLAPATFANRLPRPTRPPLARSPGFRRASGNIRLSRLLAVRPFPLRLSAYRVRYPGATRKHVEPSWGHVQIFRTVPFANTLVRRVGKNAFAGIVPARPCPVFGRPIHRGAAPLITARYFSASPSDSTSRWTPCPPVCPSTASRLSSALGRVHRFRLRARLGSRLSAHPGQ